MKTPARHVEPGKVLAVKAFFFCLLPSAFCLLPSPAPAALDFTLQHKMMAADGISQDEVYITDGPSKIFLRFPGDWKVFNSAQSLDFEPTAPGAKVRLERFPDPRVLTIDAGGGGVLQQQTQAQLPRDAKNVEAQPVEINSLAIFGWKTLEVSFRYEYYGQAVRRSVMYLDMMPGRVVQMSVVAPEADFAKVHKQARQLLSSWFEPSRDLPPDLQAKYGQPPVPGN